MIPNTTIVYCFITLFVSLILPILVLVFFCVKYKKEGILSGWLLGGLGFFVPQILIRIPIMQALPADTMLRFSSEHFFLYCLCLGFTAGLFELAGRYAAARLLCKKLTYHRALAAGLGHGGIEAMIIVGLTYLNNLVYIFMIRSGSFDALIAQTAASGGDVTQLNTIADTFLNGGSTIFLLGGFERLLTMICQAAMSLVVCDGVYRKRPIPSLLLCLGFHTLMDTVCGLISGLGTGGTISVNASYAIIYTLLSLFALAGIWMILRIRRSWQAATAEGDAS